METSLRQLYTPPDQEGMLEKYRGKGKGPCGPSCLAIIERRRIKDVLADWKVLFGEYRGWAAWKELRQYLSSKGWTVKQCRFKGEISPTAETFVLCRVQWIGPDPDKPEFACWRHWSEAAAHTHFILVADALVYCSEDGWFTLDKLNDYLDGKGILTSGVITSYMEIAKNQVTG